MLRTTLHHKEISGKAMRQAQQYPFVFLIYIVNYIERVDVSFANLRMSADLGFSDRLTV